jgi:archaellin
MWDREIRHFMIDAGADLVICHHPHIIQGVEVYNGKLIAHSLGNFVFDLTYPETMPSMILQTEVDERGFYAFSILPVFIDGFIPKPTTGELSKHILHYLAHKSKELNTYLDVNYEENKAFVIMDTLNMEVYSQPFLKFFGLQESNDYYISTPLKLTRWGNPSEINSLNSVDVWQFRSGTELIYYGNMEDEGSNMWNLNSSSEWYDIEEKFEGERSIGQTRNSSQTGNVITDFKNLHKLTPYQNYTLQGYVKTQNGANVTIEIRYYSSRDYYSQISTESVGTQLSGDNDWTYLHQEITVPPQAKFFDIRLVSFPPETGTAFSWFDNISLIGWNSWKYISEDAMIKSPNNFYYLQLKSEQFHLFNELIYTETKYHYDTAVVAENVNSPTLNAKLQQNFPNPFNANTMISFSLHKSAQVHLSLYNIKGQKVTTLIHSSLAAGNHQYEWNGKNFNNEPVASGIYFYQLKADNKIIATKKCLLLK